MTPMSATPRKLASASQNSDDPIRHSRTIDPTSTSDRPAAMTTAARALAGRSARRSGSATSSTPTRSAPTTPVSWVCAPADSATGVRDALLLTGMPERNPVARFGATEGDRARDPGSTSSPRRMRQAPRQDAHVGRRHEGDPEGCGQKGDDVARDDRRDRQGRQPDGQRADDGQT